MLSETKKYRGITLLELELIFMIHYAPNRMLVHKGGQIKNWGGVVQRCHSFKNVVLKYSKATVAILPKNNNDLKKIKSLFSSFSPINLLIILYQLTKFEAPSPYSM